MDAVCHQSADECLQDMQTPAKAPTGHDDFEAGSRGGLPQGGRASRVGVSGTANTVFALQTLRQRASTLGEVGIFVSFEEPLARLGQNASSFDGDFQALVGSKLVVLDARLAFDTVIAGEFDVAGLLVQLTALVEQCDAKSVVFDGIGTVLACLPDIECERREFLRIDEWATQQRVTCLVSGKRNERSHGQRAGAEVTKRVPISV